MKATKIIVLAILPLFCIVSCKKKDKKEDIEEAHNPIENVIISDISETGCSVNWSVYPQDITKVSIDLSENESFTSPSSNFPISDVNQSNYKVANLKGATTYFLRINALKTDGSVYTTTRLSFQTSYTKSKLFVTTTDGFKIETTIMYADKNASLKPCLLFMHELGRGGSWDNKAIVTELMGKGYVCVLFNFRGHGNSTAMTDLSQLLADKSLVAKDLDAVLRHIKKDPHVDSARCGLIGASIGGIMAVAGNGYKGVKTSVALSGMQNGIYTIFPAMTLKSTFYIAGEKDVSTILNVDFGVEAKEMYDISTDPKKVTIVPGSDFHGTDLLKVTGISTEIVQWITSTL